MKKEIRELIYKKYGGRCAYCGKKIVYGDMQVDHYIPKRSDFFTQVLHDIKDIDEISNLMPSCRRCNHYKRAYLPEQFRKVIKTLHERIERNYISKVALDYGIIVLRPHDGVFYFEKKEIKIYEN